MIEDLQTKTMTLFRAYYNKPTNFGIYRFAMHHSFRQNCSAAASCAPGWLRPKDFEDLLTLVHASRTK